MKAINFYESKRCTPKYISAITSKRLKKTYNFTTCNILAHMNWGLGVLNS